mgnify:CR=1 FL=1
MFNLQTRIGKIIASIIALAGAVGSIMLILKFLPAFILALHGDYTNATDIIVEVSVDEIISTIYFGIIVAFLGSFLAILGIKLKM